MMVLQLGRQLPIIPLATLLSSHPDGPEASSLPPSHLRGLQGAEAEQGCPWRISPLDEVKEDASQPWGVGGWTSKSASQMGWESSSQEPLTANPRGLLTWLHCPTEKGQVQELASARREQTSYFEIKNFYVSMCAGPNMLFFPFQSCSHC